MSPGLGHFSPAPPLRPLSIVLHAWRLPCKFRFVDLLVCLDVPGDTKKVFPAATTFVFLPIQ